MYLPTLFFLICVHIRKIFHKKVAERRRTLNVVEEALDDRCMSLMVVRGHQRMQRVAGFFANSATFVGERPMSVLDGGQSLEVAGVGMKTQMGARWTAETQLPPLSPPNVLIQSVLAALCQRLTLDEW